MAWRGNRTDDGDADEVGTELDDKTAPLTERRRLTNPLSLRPLKRSTLAPRPTPFSHIARQRGGLAPKERSFMVRLSLPFPQERCGVEEAVELWGQVREHHVP